MQITDEIVGNACEAAYGPLWSFVDAEQMRAALEAVAPLIRAQVMRDVVREADNRHWHVGEPPKPWREEWFIAETIYGDRACLKALPEEFTYDYKTADDTYMMARNIKRWMRFPDSNYVEPARQDGSD